MKYLKIYDSFGGNSYVDEFIELIDKGFIILYSSGNHIYLSKASLDNFYTMVEMNIGREDYKKNGLVNSCIFDDLVEIIVESTQRILYSRGFISSKVSIKNIGKFDENNDSIKYITLIEISLYK